MQVHQFTNKSLSHFSYGILEESLSQIILIDPSRNIAPYLEWATKHRATINGVIETHPHADFVSGHHELMQRTGATIYLSSKYGATFPHEVFEGGHSIKLGDLEFRALDTPGHSPDSITIVLRKLGILAKDYCVFTGDTLFIGDCGRPDLREKVGNHLLDRQSLAKLMYHSLRDHYLKLADDVIIYPAHGAGSLCGKSLSNASSSTVGAEKQGNWSLNDISEEEFIEILLKDQPFIPQYFGYDVALNIKGAPTMEAILQAIPNLNIDEEGQFLEKNILIIDTRNQEDFNQGYYDNSINLLKGNSFSTWIGSIVKPHEPFYLLANTEKEIDSLLLQIADIGYDLFIKGFLSIENLPIEKPHNLFNKVLDIEKLKNTSSDFTIVDIRNYSEVNERKIFPNSISIPLNELRERYLEIPLQRPIVVHCAGGYRSAAGSSILRILLKDALIYDLSTAVLDFLNTELIAT